MESGSPRDWPEDVRVGDVIRRDQPGHPLDGDMQRVTAVKDDRVETDSGWMSRGALSGYVLLEEGSDA